MVTKRLNDIEKSTFETTEGMHRAGVISDATLRKITIPHLGPQAPPTAEPIGDEEIRRVREQAHLSQAVHARYLGLTPGYVSQLERGGKQAQGQALALLNIIRRNGVEMLL